MHALNPRAQTNMRVALGCLCSLARESVLLPFAALPQDLWLPFRSLGEGGELRPRSLFAPILAYGTCFHKMLAD